MDEVGLGAVGECAEFGPRAAGAVVGDSEVKSVTVPVARTSTRRGGSV